MLLLFVAINGYSQKTIPLEDVSKHIGDSVTVGGQVSGGRFLETAKNTPTFINLGQAFPNHSLTIVIWNEIRKQFETAPEVLFKEKEICVAGRIELFRDRTQIVLTRKKDVITKEIY